MSKGDENLIVELMRYTPDGEKLIASAAKLCYSPVGIREIEDNLEEDKISSFLTLLMDLNHESPIEHINFTFGVEGVSRTLTHQLVRHRIASYSQQSQRYVKLDQFEYIIPPAIESNAKAKEIFIETMEKDQASYDEISEILFKEHYDSYIREGLKEKAARSKAEKEAIEDARYIFPNACETKIICTMNLRSLINFCHHRCCRRAQEEINKLAWTMVEEIEKVSPLLAKSLGASCQFGPCPEGSMCCMMPYEKKNK